MKEIEDMGYYISRIMEVVSQMRSYDEYITNQQMVAKVCSIKVCFLNRSFLELERKEIAEITSTFLSRSRKCIYNTNQEKNMKEISLLQSLKD